MCTFINYIPLDSLKMRSRLKDKIKAGCQKVCCVAAPLPLQSLAIAWGKQQMTEVSGLCRLSWEMQMKLPALVLHLTTSAIWVVNQWMENKSIYFYHYNFKGINQSFVLKRINFLNYVFQLHILMLRGEHIS